MRSKVKRINIVDDRSVRKYQLAFYSFLLICKLVFYFFNDPFSICKIFPFPFLVFLANSQECLFLATVDMCLIVLYRDEHQII